MWSDLRSNSKENVNCKLCKCVISFSNMGQKALRSQKQQKDISTTKRSVLYQLYFFVIVLFQTTEWKKENLFNNLFVSIFSPIKNNSALSPLLYKTNTRVNSFCVANKDILSIIKSLDLSKLRGYHNIWIKMRKICIESVTIPLKIIFEELLKNNISRNMEKS